MKGSDVKFGIRCYKILFEAILRTKIEFIMENVTEFCELPLFNNLKTANLCNAGVCSEKVESIINVNILPTLDGNMAKWMDSLLRMIDLLLNLIFFQRKGNWKSYLETIHTFLPWCFALNQHNYARNLSYFYVDILNIEKNAPHAHQYLATGGFTGSLSGQKLTMIPVDQMIEMTIKKQSSKVVGGLSVVTENKGASERRMRINHFLAASKQDLDLKIERGELSQHAEFSTI